MNSPTSYQPSILPGDVRQEQSFLLGKLYPGVAPATPTRLLLACQAENVQSRQTQGVVTDSGLSARGWEQSVALANWLHTHEEIDAIFTDTRLAARLTAQSVGQQFRLPVQVAHQWPRSPNTLWDREPPIARPDSPLLADVASYVEYSNSLTDALARLLEERWGSTLLFISDAVSIATLLRSTGGSSELGIWLGHTSLSEIVYAHGRWSLAYTNRTEHLPRRLPQRLLPSATSGQAGGSVPEAHAEIEKIARFYNQVAQRLGNENESASPSHPPAQEMTGEQLRHFAEINEESHLLLAGAGRGRLALELAQAGIGEVVGVDISPGMLEKAEFLRLNTRDIRHQRVNFRLAPIHDLPFKNGRFDVALLIHLLHHLADPRPSLAELHRILPAHGRLVVIDIDGLEDAVKRATQNAIEGKRNPSHALLRTGKQLTSLLEESGFRVEKQQRWKVERSASEWLGSIGAEENTRVAVFEMLEASIETDAAGLHVRRQGTDLLFDAHLIALLAQKVAD